MTHSNDLNHLDWVKRLEFAANFVRPLVDLGFDPTEIRLGAELAEKRSMAQQEEERERMRPALEMLANYLRQTQPVLVVCEGGRNG